MGKPSIWEGWYECQVDGCDERIYLLRQEPGPEGWHAQVLHDHDQGAWMVAVFKRTKGQRYWEAVKAMRATIAQQKKDARVAAKVRADSRPQPRSRMSSRTTEPRPTSPGDGSPSAAPSTTTGTQAPATTTSSGNSTATPATLEETSSTSSSKPKESAFLKRLRSSSKS